MSERIVLHDYWRSSASYRVRIALNLLRLDYERREVDLLGGQQMAADNLARNPQGLVPTLEIDGLVLTQSLAIVEYLNETRGGAFLPAEVQERHWVRSLSYAIAMEIHPICNLRVAKYAVGLGGHATMEGWMQHFIVAGLAGVEAMLAAKKSTRFCCGEHVTMADICLLPQFYNAQRWKVDVAAFPICSAISERLAIEPAFAAAHPDAVKLAP